MSSYFMNSLMQCYCNQATSIYATVADRACSAFDAADAVVNGNGSAASASSSLLFSRRHHHQQHDQFRPAGQSPYLQSLIGLQNSSSDGGQQFVPFGDRLASAVAQSVRCESSKRFSSAATHDAKYTRNGRTDIFSDYNQQVYDDCCQAATLNSQCHRYKVEKPSPPPTPDATQRQKGWNCSAYRVNNRGEQETERVHGQTEESKNEVASSEEVGLSASEERQSTASDDDGCDQLQTGSAPTCTVSTAATSTTTASDQHQQKTNSDSSCDVSETQHAVIYPIYPWMTRVHSTHGQYIVTVFECTSIVND